MEINKTSLDNYITGNYGEEEKDMQPPKIISKLKVEMIMKDLLKLIDKVEDLEQIVINQGAKQRDNYKLVNDRVDEAFDVIKMLERKVYYVTNVMVIILS